jgi:hypothetical protein
MLVIGVGHPLVGWSMSPAVFAQVSAQSENPACLLDSTQLWPRGKIGLVAASAPRASKCLEDCARTRQHCEQQDMHRPGTKEHIRWSKQCQASYNQCMDGCN